MGNLEVTNILISQPMLVWYIGMVLGVRTGSKDPTSLYELRQYQPYTNTSMYLRYYQPFTSFIPVIYMPHTRQKTVLDPIPGPDR